MREQNTNNQDPKNNDIYYTKLIRVEYNQIGETIDYIYKNQGVILSITNSPNANFKDLIVKIKIKK